MLSHDNKKKKSLKAHEHGVGILKIAQDKSTLLFEFEIPCNDIVGFEYQAKENEDKNKVRNAILILKDYKNLILPSSGDDCQIIDSNAKIINEGNHSEFISEYKFDCKNISKLKRVYIKYFDSFKLTNKLNIKIFGENKKSTYVIEKGKKIISVKSHF